MGFAGDCGKARSIPSWNEVLLYCTLLSAQETFMRVQNVNMKFWLQIRLIQKYTLTTQPFVCICLSVPLSLSKHIFISLLCFNSGHNSNHPAYCREHVLHSETHRAVQLQPWEGWRRGQKNKLFSIELPQLRCCCSNLDLALKLGREERGNKVRWTPVWAEARFTSVTVPVPHKQTPDCSRNPALLTQPNAELHHELGQCCLQRLHCPVPPARVWPKIIFPEGHQYFETSDSYSVCPLTFTERPVGSRYAFIQTLHCISQKLKCPVTRFSIL